MKAGFSPRAALAGRKLFVLGGTGFVGKVYVSMLLERFPEIGRVYLMVRSNADSAGRFRDAILPSPAFDPLRARHGDRLDAFLAGKLVVVGGDIAEENLGLSEADASRIAEDVDVIVNCAGLVVFNPPLESAFKTNVTGIRNVLAFAHRLKRPALVHVSTCYVAGNRSGERREDEPVVGSFPRRETGAEALDVEAEIRGCERLVARVREDAHEPAVLESFRRAARARLLEEARDPDDDKALRLGVARERKAWMRARLAEGGLERARAWGWPNVYTYTKALGEQLVAADRAIVRCIVRPSIVESAESYPFPGWNEGFTTTAPLVQFALKGQSLFPVRDEVVLDLIPVDSVAAALVALGAQACVEEPALVHQLCSSDLNPLRLGRVAILMGLYRRRRLGKGAGGARLFDRIVARMDVRGIGPDAFDRVLMPVVAGATRGLAAVLRGAETAGPLAAAARRGQTTVSGFARLLERAQDQLETFRPFIADNRYVFRADNTRALFQRLVPEDRDLLRWSPETIDWRHYWLDVHCPGLERWVFPDLEAAERRAPSPRWQTLLELFDGVTKAHASRVALRVDGGAAYTYADLRECALRAAAFLVGHGVGPSDRVALLAENSPEWGMACFGILKAGATCVPIGREATTDEATHVLRLAEVGTLLLSEPMARKHPGLAARLRKEGLEVRMSTFDQVFALGDEREEAARIARLPAAVPPGAVASILFTSGATGEPKGVMLTHRNFTSQVAQLLSVYEIDHRDGMLSVLPLHHSFEFSAGFLLPLSRGAHIEYLAELSGDAIGAALRRGRVTCIVGVPALWELMKRRVMSRLADGPALVREGAQALIEASSRLREETPLNLGPLLFLPVHLAFGGRIRYLISGGAALSRDTLRTFRGLGFDLNEGYGLTEAAPVVTVARPGARLGEGGVGEPLPGVDVRIGQPGRDGVGEVEVRGPGVMAGYYRDEESTRAALRDGWLRTGDLGRLDESGRLHLVGRLKEMIVGPDGENVSPEELETLYADGELIKEMAIVGLREGDRQSAERVACVAVPDDRRLSEVGRAALRARIEDHFRRVGAALPPHKRVQILEVWDGELPRTATRKVKRREVVALLEQLRARAPETRERRPAGRTDVGWLLGTVSAIAEKPRAAVAAKASLAELGFDSLMYAELEEAIDGAGFEPLSSEAMSRFRDLRELARALRPRDAAFAPPVPPAEAPSDIRVPPLLAAWGRRGLDVAQSLFYSRLLRPRIEGRANVPRDTHFIVAANHESHLDMGLAKAALGMPGEDLHALAAADYFFDTPAKRAFFGSFTNLVPMERNGSLKDSMRRALRLLEQGKSVLIFPEGTRSRTGSMQPFHRGLGHLALQARVGVVPVHLSTHHALPPGRMTLLSRDVTARIGPFLSFGSLERPTRGLPRAEAERSVSAIVQKAIEGVRDGVPARPARARRGR
jgi:long-chain acyl-CoA synthetase